MNSLVAYGSDEENDERYDQELCRDGAGMGGVRREEDANYDDVTMDMSEDSNNNESDRELPPADPVSSAARGDRCSPGQTDGKERSSSPHSRDRRYNEKERDRHSRDPERERDRHSRDPEKERDKHSRDSERERDRHSRDRERERDRHSRDQERDRDRNARDRNRDHRDERRVDRGRNTSSSSRRGLLGDKPDDRNGAEAKPVPALMDLKPFGGESHAPPGKHLDARESRGSEKERREHERERERERDRHRESHKERDRHSRRSPDRKHRRTRSKSRERRSSRDRSRERPALDPLPPFRGGASTSTGDYRPSYKVSKKLQVMEKMGLQIKTPDGSMTTAQQLMQRSATEQQTGTTSYFKPGTVATSLVAQVEKRKLLWSKKSGAASEAESGEPKPLPESAAKWTGTRFAQDTDGKVATKFMRLMGIKQPEMVSGTGDSDVNEKQERMFQDMQAQYEVARATTHTMRGVGLGFQRHL